jgi:hypothetical protein
MRWQKIKSVLNHYILLKKIRVISKMRLIIQLKLVKKGKPKLNMMKILILKILEVKR